MSKPTAPPRHLRVTDIGEYVRHQSCARRFALGYDNQAAFKALPFSGRPYSIMDPVLAQAGKQREQDWAQSLEDLGFRALTLPEREPGKGAPWEVFAALPALAQPGPCFAREVQLEGALGAFYLYGRVDFVLLRPPHDPSQGATLWLVECKASRRDRTYQRLQVVLYKMMLSQLLAQQPLETAYGLLGPESIEVAVVRIDETTHQMISLAHLTALTDTSAYERDLLTMLATWRLFLHRSQRRLVEQRSSGPVRVLGGAGTGKTVVAMHRVRYLAEHVFKAPDERILFTTFTQNLAMDIEESLRQLCSTAMMRRIEVVHLDKWVSDFLKRQGFPRQIKYFDLSKETTRDSTLADMWTESVDSYGDTERHSRTFFREEWEQVIQAQGVTSEREYFRASRQGRGVGLTRKERQAIWPVFEEYRRQMSERGVCEREDALRAARHILEQRGDILPYKCVLVDEAQDMTNEAFKLIRQIVPEQPDDIFIVGDGHQRIYNHKVVLSHCGVHIVGRSHRLKINYRTSAQIQRFAMAVLEGQRVDDLDAGEDSLSGYRSLVQGVAPRVELHESLDAELETIQAFIQAPGAAASTCLVVRTTRQLDLYERALNDRHIPTYKLSRGRIEDARRTELRLATMHRVKGLEFERVILAGVNEGEVPLARALNQSDDELVRESAELQERALFYVACSRAKREVLVTTSGKPSPFLTTLKALQP